MPVSGACISIGFLPRIVGEGEPFSPLGPRRYGPPPSPPPFHPSQYLVPFPFSPWRRRLGFPHRDDDVGLRLGGQKVSVGRFPSPPTPVLIVRTAAAWSGRG